MSSEVRLEVEVFGGRSTILVGGRAADGTSAQLAATRAAARLRLIHVALTRFDPDSELSRLNADPREAVPASPLLRRLAQAVAEAGERSGGLVDGTVLPELRHAGYRASRAGAERIAIAPGEDWGEQRPARPDPRGRWQAVRVQGERIVRPPGIELDGGGLVKGMACDLIAGDLARHPLFAIECSGDLRFGGTSGAAREVGVDDPFGREAPARWQLADGAVATSGVTRRAWREDGRLVHHLIDPGRGAPASTGVVQATALAPTALEAEVRAKAALLAGPEDGLARLPHGGVLVLADGEVLHAPRAEERAAA